MPKLQLHLSVIGHAQSIGRHRRPQGIAAHALELLALASRYEKTRMQIEAVRPRVTASRRGRLDRLERVPQTTKARASMRSERHGSLHGRGGQPRQHRRFVGPRVRHGALVIAFPEAPSIEQARDSRLHGGQHLCHIQRREARPGMKAHHTGVGFREHAVEHQRVDMHVEIERPAESLNHGHRATTTVRDASIARASAQKAEHAADEHGDDGATQVVVPRHLVPQAVRQTDNPLPDRHVGEHVVEQVGGALGHPAVPQLGQSARPLHENGTSRSRPQSPQRNRANPPASEPHRRKFWNSSSTNRGRPSPSRRHAACTRKVSK
jgi:hypothetical protein